MKPTLGILGSLVLGLASAGCAGGDDSFNLPAGGNDSEPASTDGGSAGGTLIGSGAGAAPTGAIGTGGSEPPAGTGGTVVSSKPDDIVDSGAPADVLPSTGGIDWNTQFVALHADDFRIEAAGKTFLGEAADASLHSDPGTPNAYTTFEREWTENGVPMRLYIYFHSDGKDWWASEIRIYNGLPDGDWLAVTSEAFRSPLGQAFTGDLDLTFPEQGGGRLVMHGLRLQAFLTPEVCLNHTEGYVIEVLYPTIDMTTSPNSGFGVNVRLRDGNCDPVVDTSAFVFVWSVDDPTLVALSYIVPASTNVQLKGLAVGVTTLRVSAQRRSDGVVVAQGTMLVTITAPTSSS